MLDLDLYKSAVQATTTTTGLKVVEGKCDGRANVNGILVSSIGEMCELEIVFPVDRDRAAAGAVAQQSSSGRPQRRGGGRCSSLRGETCLVGSGRCQT
jgi:hypothetical protein